MHGKKNLIFFLLFLPLFNFAQLCNGSLGDAIAYKDFGTISKAILPPGNTTYTFINDDCPNDNFYTINNNVPSCFGNTWHNITHDHTGNANGQMMVINASFTAGTFYIDTVKNLCAGTTFEFSSWVINLLKPSACGGNGIEPNLTFLIQDNLGSTIQSFNTGNISSTLTPIWQKYGFYFTLPPIFNTIVLKIINNAPGGCGNDIALDDIGFRPCGPLLSGLIENYPSLEVSHCSGKTIQYKLIGNINFNNYLFPAYKWQQFINQNWQDISFADSLVYQAKFNAMTKPGIYQFRMQASEKTNINSPQCRVSSPIFTIQVLESPKVDAGPDKTILLGDSVQLQGNVSGDSIHFFWLNTNSINNRFILTPNVFPEIDDNFILQATSLAGCGNVQDGAHVTVIKNIFIPTAFSPNGDGKNDVWQIPSLVALPGFELKVYNRWGQLVFFTKNANQYWDGTYKNIDVPTGEYVYWLKLLNHKTFKGTVLVIR